MRQSPESKHSLAFAMPCAGQRGGGNGVKVAANYLIAMSTTKTRASRIARTARRAAAGHNSNPMIRRGTLSKERRWLRAHCTSGAPEELRSRGLRAPAGGAGTAWHAERSFRRRFGAEKCSATYSSASWPRDFFSRRACSRRTASFDGSMVVVMRTRFGRPDFGRPADSRRFSAPSASSSSGHTRELSGAIVKDVGERDAVLYENIARCLSDHRLHVNPYFRADRRPPDARGANCR